MGRQMASKPPFLKHIHFAGGQCTSWKRKGYVFEACIHSLNGFKPNTRVNAFWQELGAMPCELVRRNEFISAVHPDGTCFNNYFELEKLESHLKKISPQDSPIIDEYILGLKSFLNAGDLLGKTNLGNFGDKLSTLPFFLSNLKYFRYTLGTFGKRFKHPLLRKAFPLLRYGKPAFPLFGYLAEHSAYIYGEIGWPRGGGLAFAGNIAARYIELGGEIQYRKKVVKILTDQDRACGVELDDGTQYIADFVISNSDGRKTIQNLLEGRYKSKMITRFCEPIPENQEIPSAVMVFLGVNRDLASYPSAMILFLKHPEMIAGQDCEYLHLQLYGFDDSMAPAGKGVIKVEFHGRPTFFSDDNNDPSAYQKKKDKIVGQVITLLEQQFPGLQQDVEAVDITTLRTWERFMGGTLGHNNYPRKYASQSDIRQVLDFVLGLNRTFTLPGLQNFFFTGQWVTSMGSLFSNALTGKTVVQKICKQCKIPFQVPEFESSLQ